MLRYWEIQVIERDCKPCLLMLSCNCVANSHGQGSHDLAKSARWFADLCTPTGDKAVTTGLSTKSLQSHHEWHDLSNITKRCPHRNACHPHVPALASLPRQGYYHSTRKPTKYQSTRHLEGEAETARSRAKYVGHHEDSAVLGGPAVGVIVALAASSAEIDHVSSWLEMRPSEFRV